ncbi:SMP-30/gluconolactonase/LRE family protein [Hymenobacter cheonanensis]|uniref:SMP-30/gluconolactonase/LRE family protein n=1 Tax=Hymenobacter sp. CA2-7 TaxID=3063993 RepID=UPI0027138459|nr:L-dopachrome tautomerase-related protein [Hymenobacter sp. CA2-7]MDO7888257.1 L-dopachrome tautomerase-related protein [Hymenobacter sp. CA2-7]
MPLTRFLLPAGLALLAACSGGSAPEKTTAVAAPPPVPTSESARQLVSVATSDTIWNGVAVSDNDRVFVLFPHNEGSPGTRIGELKNGKATPWPTRAWNAWKKEGDPAKQAFVRANSLRFGPDGLLWIVDTGTPKSDAPPIADGPKLLGFDIAKNQLVKTIALDKYVKRKSFVDDLRFHGDMIYVTDAGAPGLIILNQKTGQGRRLLDDDSTTTARRPMLGEGKKMVKPDGSDVKLHADQMEVSPDGRYYYFQTAAGPMYRVETKYLDDPSISSAELARQVTYFFNSPTCGGTTIDAAGNLYVADANHKRVLKVTPDGQSSTLVQSPSLIWVDAMWIDHAGNLWLPVPQMNRTAGFQKGVETVAFPVQLYKMPIGARPFRD